MGNALLSCVQTTIWSSQQPDSSPRNQIDHVAVCGKFRRPMLDTRTFRRADAKVSEISQEFTIELRNRLSFLADKEVNNSDDDAQDVKKTTTTTKKKTRRRSRRHAKTQLNRFWVPVQVKQTMDPC